MILFVIYGKEKGEGYSTKPSGGTFSQVLLIFPASDCLGQSKREHEPQLGLILREDRVSILSLETHHGPIHALAEIAREEHALTN